MVTPTIAYINYFPNPSGSLIPRVKIIIIIKQSSWDRPGLLVDSVAVEESCTSPFQRAILLATRAPHSGDWLLAPPITACGLRLEDEAVRIAVALRLCSELGSPHTCRCGSLVEATGVHGLVCKQAPAEL